MTQKRRIKLSRFIPGRKKKTNETKDTNENVGVNIVSSANDNIIPERLCSGAHNDVQRKATHNYRCELVVFTGTIVDTYS
jgi:hypothetical protein